MEDNDEPEVARKRCCRPSGWARPLRVTRQTCDNNAQARSIWLSQRDRIKHSSQVLHRSRITNPFIVQHGLTHTDSLTNRVCSEQCRKMRSYLSLGLPLPSRAPHIQNVGRQLGLQDIMQQSRLQPVLVHVGRCWPILRASGLSVHNDTTTYMSRVVVYGSVTHGAALLV